MKPHFWVKMFASGFGTGYIPFAPGTFGTLVGVAWWAFIYRMSQPLSPALGYFFFALLLIATFFAGVGLATAADRAWETTDSPRIVIDEILAFPLTMLLMPINVRTAILCFVLFRVIDIAKPPPIRWLQNLPRGYGVMADDYAAAAYTCILAHLVVIFLAPHYFGWAA
ncbi:MAG: phosphatidylglycerophosphatase A [Verrucomicrobiae bacterium]|nr:phosphatidylglycerophosphatase A [Verrucomicrobiae bacterium]